MSWCAPHDSSSPKASTTWLSAVIAPIGLRFGLPLDRRQRRPQVYPRHDHGDVTAHFPWDLSLQRRLSPAVPGEESGRVLRYWGMRNSLQNCGVAGGGEGVTTRVSWFPSGGQRVISRRRERFPYFCRKTPADFGVDAYWKSTGGLVLGKSAAKDSLLLLVAAKFTASAPNSPPRSRRP